MDETLMNAVFQPKLSKMETKADITARVAHEVLTSEATARVAKTDRLRAERLMMEARLADNPPKKALATKIRRARTLRNRGG